MNSLDNHCLQLIFKHLNLNERTSIRLINKRFRELCDLIFIDKLIVFENRPPKADKLEFTYESYSELDCVYIEDLWKFFNNPIIQKQLNSIRVLKILTSEYEKNFKLTTKFKNLNYLSLDNLDLIGFEVFESSKIEYLIIENILYNHLNANLKYRLLNKPIDTNIFLTGFIHLRSKNIKFLKLVLEVNKNFFSYLSNNNLMDNLERLDCILQDFNTLEYLSESFGKLKRIDCLIKYHLGSFIDEAKRTDVKQVANKLRKNLEVYLFGILFNKSSADFMIRFLSSFINGLDHCIMRNGSRMVFELTSKTLRLLKNNDNNLNLKEFHKLFSSIYLNNADNCDKKLFEKFINCIDINYYLEKRSPSPKCIEKQLQINQNQLEQFSIGMFDLKQLHIDNKILDLLPKYQNQINALVFESYEKINFDFLFKLTKLRYLAAVLFYPIDQNIFFNLIKQNRYLQFINLMFFRTDDLTKENLINFKKNVIKFYEEELNVKNIDLKIEIYTKNNIQFISFRLQIKAYLKIKHHLNFPQFAKARYFDLYDYLKRNKLNNDY